MHQLDFLQDLAVVLAVAGLVTVLFHRFKQPVVLGYILAGVIIGPHTPPFSLVHLGEGEHGAASIQGLADLGVILLMFSLGLHFSLRQLARVGATAFIAASLEIVLMVLIGYEVGRLFRWSTMDSLFLGAILSISSTTIIIKALSDLGRTREKFAELIFGVLIVEDILAVAMLALLSSIAMTGGLHAGEVAGTLGRLAVFLAVTLVAGLLVVPALLRYLARFRSNEMMVVAALGLCFGVSLLAAKLGYSVALGAFLIGAVIAETREAKRIEALVEPVRDVFSAVFFVAIGMLIDPRLLVEYAVPIAVITVAVVVGKVLTCGAGTLVAGHDTRTSLRVGMGLAQIGEFSFIIAQLGLTLKVTSDFLYPIAVTVSAVTTLLTPYLIRASDPLAGVAERTAPRPLLATLSAYQQWVTGLGGNASGETAVVRRTLRRAGLQILLNLVLVSGLLIAAAPLGLWVERRLRAEPHWSGGPKAGVWLAAVLLALPLLIASFRKLRAVSRLLAEAIFPEAAAGRQGPIYRRLLAHAVLAVGSALIVLWVISLSAATLPPWPGLLALLIVAAGVAWVMWRSFVRLYARAQASLEETLAGPVEKQEVHHGGHRGHGDERAERN